MWNSESFKTLFYYQIAFLLWTCVKALKSVFLWSMCVCVCVCVFQSGAAGCHCCFDRGEESSADTCRKTRPARLHSRADICSGECDMPECHTHFWNMYKNDWPVCVCLEPRGVERWERQAVCVGDGDRGSRHSLYQSVLHVAVAQTESRRGIKDPAGNGHCPRYEQTHKIQSSYFKLIISSSLCHFQPVLHKKVKCWRIFS